MLFDDRTKMQIEEVVGAAFRKAQQVLFILLGCFCWTLTVGVTLFLEGHLLFNLFKSISGDKGEYWSPEYMSISAGVVAIAFHILAREHQENFAIRFVNKSTQFLIPIYLLGIGLIISGMIVGDGIGAILEGDVVSWDFAATQPQESYWEGLFNQFSHPVATLAFSVGVGGFAIINIFVVHELLQRIEQGASTSIDSIKMYHAVKKDYTMAIKCHEEYLETEYDLADLELFADDQYIADQQAAIALNAIDTALAPHEEFFKEQLLKQNHQPTLIGIDAGIDTKQLEKFIGKIRALDLAGIKKSMLSK